MRVAEVAQVAAELAGGFGGVATSIPSPSSGVWEIGPFPLRGYAVCIILGVFVAVWVGDRRWVARGGEKGFVADLAIWAVPFGLVGGRLYHVITDHERYFGEDKNPITALYLWNGGLGIWGAIALGAVGAWIAARRAGVRFLPVADALAPGIVLAQAVGRWGNWFNQELFGKPTDLPWGLEIDPDHRPFGYAEYSTFHPTFLYESLWCVLVAVLVIWADRRFRLGHGRAFALYVAAYTVGRGWTETLRIDAVQLDDIGGFRVNFWVSLVLFLAATAYVVAVGLRRPGREASVYLPGREPAPAVAGGDGTVVTPSDPDVAQTTEIGDDQQGRGGPTVL